MDTAPVGQTATQCPHRMQLPFTRAVTPSTSKFAPTQSSTQRPHPMQYLLSISISMLSLLARLKAAHPMSRLAQQDSKAHPRAEECRVARPSVLRT